LGKDPKANLAKRVSVTVVKRVTLLKTRILQLEVESAVNAWVKYGHNICNSKGSVAAWHSKQFKNCK